MRTNRERNNIRVLPRFVNSLTRLTRAIRLGPRLNAAFTLLIVAPTLITAMMLGARMYASIETGAIDASASNVEQVRKTIDIVIAHHNREIRVAATRLDFLKAVRQYMRSGGSYARFYEVNTFINVLMGLSMSLDNRIALELVYPEGMMARLDYRIVHEDLSQSEIYQKSMVSKEFMNWFSTRPLEYSGHVGAYRNPLKKSSAIVVTAKLRDYVSGDVLALMVVALDESLLSNLYDAHPPDGTQMLILDADGRVISSSNKALILTQAQAEVIQGIRDSCSSSGYFSVKLGQGRELVSFSTSALTGWRVVSINRYQNMMAGLYAFIPMVLALVVSCLSVALLLAMLVSRSVTTPASFLARAMARVKTEQCFDVSIDDDGHDELHTLAEHFNDMVAHTSALIKDIERAQSELREAEFKALQSQINPHFLYNTLDTISWMAFNHGAADIAQITGSLSRLYRLTLNQGLEKCKVQQELEHVKHYLAIYLAAHMVSIEVFYDVDEVALNLATLKLILQPLVENAIFHGIEPAGGTGRIWIRAILLEGKLLLQVEDDGVGTGETVVESKGYGVHNIDTRVKLYYGAEYGMSLNKRTGGGTVASITQPAMMPSEEQR